MSESLIYVDHETSSVWLNESGVPTDQIMHSLRMDPVYAALDSWARSIRPASSTRTRAGGLFERDRYVSPARVREQMLLAFDAVEADDIVSGVLQTTDENTFKGCSIDCPNPETADVLNQWADEIKLIECFREMWQELFTYSQCYPALWWDTKLYTRSGKGPKDERQARKQFSVKVPTGFTTLDVLKVVPVGSFMFGNEQLCYISDLGERDMIDQAIMARNNQTTRVGDQAPDRVAMRLITGKHEASLVDRMFLARERIDPNALYTMSDDVFRITSVRSGGQRFASVRMKSIFPLLDLKNQLRESDRAHLIGAANFIVVVRKGSDKNPATPGELTNLQAAVPMLTKMPVLIGDQRLSVEIVTPKNDRTLDISRYLNLDLRIHGRLWGMFLTPGSQGDDVLKVARVAAQGLESRRARLKTEFETQVLKRIARLNPELIDADKATIAFDPPHIAFAFDPALAVYILDLLDRGGLSLDSALSAADFDLEEEARKRTREKEEFKGVFIPDVLPPGSPGLGPGAGGGDPKSAGRRGGGNKSGGGAAPGSGQGQEPANPAKPKDPGSKRSRMAAFVEELRAAEATESEIARRVAVEKARLEAEYEYAVESIEPAPSVGDDDEGDDE